VTLRFDPRDMGEIRVFHDQGFLCRAVSADLAGETVPLREIIRARNRRRRELRAVLRDRQQAVETLLEIKRGESTAAQPGSISITETENAKALSPIKPTAPALKRYRNE
jgi:putative transposase